MTTPTVAFKDRYADDATPTAGSKIVYTEVVLNHGDGYNSVTGEFTVPHDGLYFFTLQICTFSRAWVRAHIVGDDKVIGSAAHTCTSGSGMAVLTAGDIVWVKSTTITGNGMARDSNIWNSFPGMLVHN